MPSRLGFSQNDGDNQHRHRRLLDILILVAYQSLLSRHVQSRHLTEWIIVSASSTTQSLVCRYGEGCFRNALVLPKRVTASQRVPLRRIASSSAPNLQLAAGPRRSLLIECTRTGGAMLKINVKFKYQTHVYDARLRLNRFVFSVFLSIL